MITKNKPIKISQAKKGASSYLLDGFSFPLKNSFIVIALMF